MKYGQQKAESAINQVLTSGRVLTAMELMDYSRYSDRSKPHAEAAIKKRFEGGQIIRILREMQAGMREVDVCAKHLSLDASNRK